MNRLSRAARPILLTLAIAISAPAAAQTVVDKVVDARLRKLEAEVSALQREVFPGGDGKYFPPQVQPAANPATQSGTPATSALTDVLARMDSLEGQVQRLTAQQEETSNRIAKLEARIASLETAASAAPSAATLDPAQASVAATPPATQPAVSTPAAVVQKPTSTPAPVATKPAASGPSAARLAAVQKIEKPQSSDPGEDEYNYGFRLWDAKFYPEAEQQLKLYLEKYSKHLRASYARNLLGRAYLDEGNYDEAGTWFYQNYTIDKNGARAPDSLLFLADAMIRKKDNNRACIALARFADDYAPLAQGRLRSQYEGLLGKVKCN
jgi:TolA-binding protein